MRRVITLSALLATAALAAPALAQGELMCAPRDEVVKQLGAQFSETPVSRGLTGDGMLLEVFASPQGTWTAVLSEPTGVSCLVSGGEAWQSIDHSVRTGVPEQGSGMSRNEYRM
ncbi:MAG: hypothetical protein ACYC1L_04595 [Alphaproteobacteria bacterium]